MVAVLGDGSLTGGMAYEALNNLGHAGKPVVIVLNDNGRVLRADGLAALAGLTHLRLNPSYVHARERIRHILREHPRARRARRTRASTASPAPCARS